MNTTPEPTILKTPIRQSHPLLDKFYDALAQAQATYPPVEKRHTAKVVKNGVHLYSFNYADLADVMNAVRPALNKNGIAIQHFPLLKNSGMLYIVCRLAHKSGQWIEAEYPAAGIGDSINHQTMGGGVTFAKRQSLCAVAGVAAEEDIAIADADDGADIETPRERPPERSAAQPPRRQQQPPPRREANREQAAAAPSGSPFDFANDPLVRAMRAVDSVVALGMWHQENEAAIRAQPSEWQDAFYARYDHHKAELSGQKGLEV